MCATSAEPSYSILLAPGRRGGVAGLRREDILDNLHGARIKVLDCAVTHTAAAFYASQEAGYVAAIAETRKCQAFERFGDGADYEFLPLAVESFGLLGKEVARFRNDLGDIAAVDGCASKTSFVRIVRQELSCTFRG